MINFFSFQEKDNSILISSVDFDKSLIFFRDKKDFKIQKLYTIKEDHEFSILPVDTEPYWVNDSHHIELHDMFEKIMFNPVSYAEIDLENNGSIYYAAAQLIVTYPPGLDLKPDTMKMLENMGYYASEEIFEFCRNNPGQHLLEPLFGINPEDITDEFDHIKAYTKTLNSGDNFM